MAYRAKLEANPGVDEETRGVAGAQVVQKVFSLLNLIADAPHPMRFSDLLRYTSMPRGTLHRLLQALLDERMIRINESDQTYALGQRTFEMAHRVWNDFDLRGAAEPELKRLSKMTSETSRLGILDRSHVVIIDQCEFIQPIRLGNGIGSRLTAMASAIGKAILAYLEPDELLERLSRGEIEALTPNTICDPDQLRQELDLVKARGYAVSVEEQFLGISAVAAPILDHRGKPMGALSITGASNRLSADKLHSLGREVIEAARRTAGNVGETFMTIGNSSVPLQAVDKDLTCVVPSAAFLGEAPVWLEKSAELLWVDILAPAAHLSRVDTSQTRTIALGELVGAIVPRKRGGFVAAAQSGFRALDLNSGETILMASPDDIGGRRFNDAKCDPAGRLWAGTLSIDASPGKGVLYCLDPDSGLRTIEQGFDICNGMGWSPDSSTYYLADSGARKIYAYDFDLASGSVANRRIFVDCSQGDGMPDGLAVDSDGCIWVAMWDGWAVRRYTADGRLDRTLSMPVPRPTSCAFGGRHNQTLFITSARIRLSASQLAAAPMSGSVFALPVETSGVPVASYAG